MTLIRQRGTMDCVVAAVAMFADLEYETVLEKARRHFLPKWRGGGIAHVSELLRDLGYRQENYVSDKQPPVGSREFRAVFLPDYAISPNLLREWLWGRRAIFSVPSLNREGGWHVVYYDGRRVWDPQEGRRGKKFHVDFKGMMPREAWVWRETA